MKKEKLQSQVISFLRFPLCVAVVLIHIRCDTKECFVHPIYDSVNYLFAQILTRVAVPLFFMFSGFLFFNRSDEFTLLTYREKLMKRIRTLLIPYIFWNCTLILYYLLGRLLGLGSQFGIGFDMVDWFRLFWNGYIPPQKTGYGVASFPVLEQFWYIRDLMVTILLSPIIFLMIKKCGLYFIIGLAILWITNSWPLITGLSIMALFFFSLGAYCSIFKKNFVELLSPHTLFLGIAWLLILIPIFLQRSYCWTPLRCVGVLLGMAFTISLAARILSKGKCKTNKFLSESSFFIFAFHMTAFIVIEDIANFSYRTDMMCTILYFVKSLAIVILGLTIYYFLRRWLPRFTAIITGGR